MAETAATPLAWAVLVAYLERPFVLRHALGHPEATLEAYVWQDEQLLRPCLLPNQSPGVPSLYDPSDWDDHWVRHEAAAAEERQRSKDRKPRRQSPDNRHHPAPS